MVVAVDLHRATWPPFPAGRLQPQEVAAEEVDHPGWGQAEEAAGREEVRRIRHRRAEKDPLAAEGNRGREAGADRRLQPEEEAVGRRSPLLAEAGRPPAEEGDLPEAAAEEERRTRPPGVGVRQAAPRGSQDSRSLSQHSSGVVGAVGAKSFGGWTGQ